MALFFHAYSTDFIPKIRENFGNMVDEEFEVPAYECGPIDDDDGDEYDGDGDYDGDEDRDIDEEDEEKFYMHEVGENAIHCHINYEAGAWAFYEAFLTNIANYCPVDTGRLLGNCGCQVIGSDGDYELFCWADTPYAEYVEYGTTYMRGQHYFERAICEAVEEAMPVWIAEKESEEKEQSYSQAMEQAYYACEGLSGMGIFTFVAIIIFTIIIMAILEAIKRFIYEITYGNSYSLKNDPADFIYSVETHTIMFDDFF